MTTNETPARLAFLSAYQGEVDYQVLDGPMAGCRVRLRFRNALGEAEFAEYRTPQGHAERLASAGGVVRSGDQQLPVTADVLAAVRLEHASYIESLVRLGCDLRGVAERIDALTWSPADGYGRVEADQGEADIVPARRSAGIGMCG